MNGLELARAYWEEIGFPALEAEFPELCGRMAFGLAGEGSECFGFDDQLSQDHDWGPAFCIWLEERDYRLFGGAVQRCYRRLPRSFQGYPPREESTGGEGRVGCLSIQRWYFKYTGTPLGPQTLEEWRKIPERFLATAVNGTVFSDSLGTFSAVRRRILEGYPADLRLKKLAARAASMAQAGQYNYPRCLRRGDRVAAQLELDTFLRAAMTMAYLLENRYAPYDKWLHRGLSRLKRGEKLAEQISRLCTPVSGQEKVCTVEEICRDTGEELRRQGLTERRSEFLLDLCPELLAQIRTPWLREMHVMEE